MIYSERTWANVSAALQALFAAAMLTLLIACANVAALVGARGADRAGEMAVRGALGATRARVLGQLITESLVLALAGGALGLLFGRWALTVLVAMAPVSIPRLAEISLDGRVLGVGLAATMLTGLAVGVAPALRLSRLTESSGLSRVGWQRTTPRPNGRRALVLVQIAICRRPDRRRRIADPQLAAPRHARPRIRGGPTRRRRLVLARRIQRRHSTTISRAGRAKRDTAGRSGCLSVDAVAHAGDRPACAGACVG